MDKELKELLEFPVTQWGIEGSKFWHQMAAELNVYVPPLSTMKIKNLDRKWELVSAYQKSVRRGDLYWAHRCASAFLSHPEELTYWWRRICTTACEDMGPGNDDLMIWIIAASQIFTPKKTDQEFMRRLVYFVTEQMCNANRSRAYCSLSIIEGKTKSMTGTKGYTGWELNVLDKLQNPTPPQGALEEWLEKNNWRGEGMLKFARYDVGLELKPVLYKIGPPNVMYGLPTYCYDMHTKVGKTMTYRMCGVQEIKEFLIGNVSTEDKPRVIGWAIFHMEGGLIGGELRDQRLYDLERKVAAHTFGWKPETYDQFLFLMEKQLHSGKVDEIRKSILDQTYGGHY